MILLILHSQLLEEAREYLNLNSIMILLILGSMAASAFKTIFKFHYDSINSENKRNVECELMKFKFHYDSINSQ